MKKILYLVAKISALAAVIFTVLVNNPDAEARSMLLVQNSFLFGVKVKIEGKKDEYCWGPKTDCSIELSIGFVTMKNPKVGSTLVILTEKSTDNVFVDEQVFVNGGPNNNGDLPFNFTIPAQTASYSDQQHGYMVTFLQND